MGRPHCISDAVRFIRQCGRVGIGEARRRVRERMEDDRIREGLYRHELLSEREKDVQLSRHFSREIDFAVCFLKHGKPEQATIQSLQSQTFRYKKTEPDPSHISGEQYIVFMEADAVLHPGALYECAVMIQETGADLLYADEDWYIRQPKDVMNPFCKPDYGPDSLRGCCYIGPFLVCRYGLLAEAGAEEYAMLDANEQWDAVISMAEKAGKICHIPKVLYYRRVPEGKEIPKPILRRISDRINDGQSVSILIPNKDHREDLKRCVDSIREKTTWPNWEILVIENNSTEEETFRYYEELKADPRIRVISREGAFNFSALNNLGAREAKGEQILLLNNDTEVISPDWIQEMLMYAQRQDVGAVGAKLYYPDGTIQHAGIGIGIKMLAGHYFRGFMKDSDGYYGRLKYAQNVSAVTAACMMIPRKVYEETHGLDESFSVVFNDVDLCLRIRQAGYLIVWTPWAELIHYESKSRGSDEDTPEKKRFFVRETNRFLRKWWKVLDAGDPYYNVNLTRQSEDFSLRGKNR